MYISRRQLKPDNIPQPRVSALPPLFFAQPEDLDITEFPGYSLLTTQRERRPRLTELVQLRLNQCRGLAKPYKDHCSCLKLLFQDLSPYSFSLSKPLGKNRGGRFVSYWLQLSFFLFICSDTYIGGHFSLSSRLSGLPKSVSMIDSLFSLLFDLFQIPAAENNPFLVGMHYWYFSYSPQTQHCNVCREGIPALSRDVIICEGNFLIPL